MDARALRSAVCCTPPTAAHGPDWRLALTGGESRDRRPILVTGAHRSGTTWVGKMLALAPGVGYIHEPFNPTTSPGISPAPFPCYFFHVSAENEAEYVPYLERTLAFDYDVRAQLPTIRTPRRAARTALDLLAFARARLGGARPLVKDPIAIFSAEWLASRFGMQVVVTIRHPAAFASSLKRLGWRHGFQSFLDQPLLMEQYLAPFEAEIRVFAERERDVIDQAALLWRLIYHTVQGYRTRHPDWVFVRHEDLSLDPLAGFAGLYEGLDLCLTERARRGIRSQSDEDNPSEAASRHSVRLASRENVGSWRRRLSDAEVARVRTAVADVASSFYSDADW